MSGAGWRGFGVACALAVSLGPFAFAADSVLCDPSLSTTGGKWSVRWGLWADSATEPLYHVQCAANQQSTRLSTNVLNAGALEYAMRTPGTLRRSDVSFMVPSMSAMGTWNHVASLAAYDPVSLGRIGADVFHDPNGVDPDRLVIQFNKYADIDCEGSNLHNWIPIPGNLQANHWYRLSAQIAQREDGGLNVVGLLQDVEREDRPILVATSYAAPASCTPNVLAPEGPAWYPNEARWGIGTMASSTGAELYLDDFAGFPAPLAFQEASGQVVIEAENWDGKRNGANGAKWQLDATQAGFSGTGYLEALPNSGVNQDTAFVANSPELVYSVRFATPGTYYVWLRGAGPTGADDSVHVGLDNTGSGPSSSTKVTTFPVSWAWSRAKVGGGYATLKVPTAGLHTVHLWMREDGFRVDKILLRTSSSSLSPAGTGPAESPRGP